MSVVCQNVATLTTTTVVTTLTVYVSTSFSQGVGAPPEPLTVTRLVPSTTCSSFVTRNVTSENCVTMTMTSFEVEFPTASQIGTQVPIPVTVTSQVFQTQLNTLFGSVCNTISVQQPSTSTPTTTTTTTTSTTPTSTPTPTPTPPTPTQPPPPEPIPPQTPPPPVATDTSYTTQIVTITGPPPTLDTTTTSATPESSSSSISRSTVYHGNPTPEPASSDTAIGAISSSSSSSSTPVGAIAGGVVGGVVAIVLLGSLAYLLIFKKSLFSPKGYERPGGEDTYDQFQGSANGNEQSRLYGPQMQEQGGYYPYQDGTGYGQQLQGSAGGHQYQYSGAGTDGTGYGQQLQGSAGGPQSLQNSGQLQPQDFNGQNLYGDSQFWQQASGAVVRNRSAVAALPTGAAAAAVVGHSPHSSISSSGSPGSHLSNTPLVRGSRHRQQRSQGSFVVPYRGYAEPVHDP